MKVIIAIILLFILGVVIVLYVDYSCDQKGGQLERIGSKYYVCRVGE